MKINSDKWYVILSSNDKNKKTELNGGYQQYASPKASWCSY